MATEAQLRYWKRITGRKLSEEHKEKISKSNKGKIKSAITRERLSRALMGKKLSLQHIENLKISHTGKKLPIEQRKKMSLAHKGHSVSSETKQKIGIANKGRKSPFDKGRINTPERKEKNAGRPKPPDCEICGAIGRICYDHDHKTEKFRGWICWRCNIVLGHCRDSKELLSMLITYLEKNTT